MKKLVTALGLAAIMAVLSWSIADAQPAPEEPRKLTLRECMGVLTGLSNLDGRKVLVQAGRPNESVEFVSFSFKASVRDAISHNIFSLQPVQQEVQAANRRAQQEIGKGATIQPGSREAVELDGRMNDYLDRPCKVDLDRLRDSDLNIEANQIPPSILGMLFPIRDRGQ